ncbi:hypothetical protein G6016_13585, partial [Dietzia aerolata]
MNPTHLRSRAAAGAMALALAGSLAVAGPAATAQPAIQATAAPLLITEYVEGSRFNKGIEITNTGEAEVNLSEYSVHVFSNGNTTSSSEALTGTLAPGDSFVYGSNRATFPVDQASGAGLWNGDDAIVLYHGETVVDSFGRVGEAPGSAWTSGDVTTIDATLRRNQGSSADTDPFDTFGPAAEWTAFPTDTFDDLGTWGEGAGDPGDPGDPG